MSKSKSNPVSKNLHLIVSIIALVPIGIIYGSKSLVTEFFDIQVNTIDQSNMLRATMFLYLAVCFALFLGAWKAKNWKSATQLNIMFMLSLATGRALSMLLDGMPTQGYIISILVEITLGIFSIYQLKKYTTNQTYK